MADITLLLIALVWGTTFLIVQQAIASLPPNTFNAVRFTVAALFLLVILLIRNRRQLTEFRGPIIRAGIILGFWLCLGYALQTVGLLYTTPSKAGFITGLSVVLVPLFSFLLLRDRIKVVAVIGVILAAAGLYLLTQNQEFSFNLGDALVFGCAICFAMQIVFTGKYAPHFSALPLAIVQLGTVAVMSWLYAFFFEDWSRAFDPAILFIPEVAMGLIVTSIFATALAFLAQTALQKQTSSTRVALIFALEPVFAALTSYIFIHEVLNGRQLTGCLMIFTGMILAELPIAQWLQQARERKDKTKAGRESA
ncbi:MAG TPA: EamA family transporter [Brevibacillus sp.]|jgi:Predicted permease, DMT superfamily|nr:MULTISPECIES: DMT family transporter [Brevibacillus]NRQ55643.1 DMT family transporter [Brevibacillus sp. HD1.4A]MBU8714753.1 DMT family transporter [Brevibacillus parabrevis]RNB95455.1 DMT family transporter [Brevibacillus parabrevis]UED71920.1 DMT family transporter [Brevibacillus sp. HD3.3A]WDV98153.1 DMT family transporter [Brevibacillus parabrevis]